MTVADGGPSAAASTPIGTVDTVVEGSMVVDTARRARDWFSGGRLVRATYWFATTSRNSWLYRWLTAEPEPEVIVIDLRETWTVGPVIDLLDWCLSRPGWWTLEDAWRISILYRLVEGTARRLERALDTRIGRAIVALLEPPELP